MAKRVYTVPFAGVSVSVAQDLFSILATSGMAFELHEVRIGQITTTSIALARIQIKKATGGFSQGSGGSAPTVQPIFATQAATVTAHVNDTSQASGGTITSLLADVFNYVNGFLYLPAEEDRIIFPPSSACLVTIDATIPMATTMSGTLTLAELF